MKSSGKSLFRLAVKGAVAWSAAAAAVRWIRRCSFAGSSVLITGGSRGLGLVLGRRFAAAGAKVAICARDSEELERARADIARLGGEVLALRCDITEEGEIEQTVAAVEAAFGPIDVLVNNAGVIQVGPAELMSAEDYEHEMALHFWGPLRMIQAVLPQMQRRGSGRIVNISSIGGTISVPHLLPYCVSKFALAGLSEGLRAELLPQGIYVTTVCPGLMRTGSTVNAMFKGKNQQEFSWFSALGSAPLLSVSAEHAAEKIFSACRDGRAHLLISLPAKAAATFHALAPSAAADALSLAARLLPRPGGIGAQQVRGANSRPSWLPSWVTARSDRAARRNNELAPEPTGGQR